MMRYKFRRRDTALIAVMSFILIAVFVIGVFVGANSRLRVEDSAATANQAPDMSGDPSAEHNNAGVVPVKADKTNAIDKENSAEPELVEDLSYDDENAQVGLNPQLVEVFEQGDNQIRTGTEPGDNWVDNTSIRETVLLDVPSYNQLELGYPLGCELVALAMMMNYSHDVDISELYAEFPRSDNPYEGFRGDPASSSHGWTIFPSALAELMNKHMGSSYDMSDLEMDDLKEQLNTNTPIVVWVNGLGWPVHALCLTGYDKNGFYYNDPATGEGNVFITYDGFYEIWNRPIYDSVLNLTYSPKIALSYYS